MRKNFPLVMLILLLTFIAAGCFSLAKGQFEMPFLNILASVSREAGLNLFPTVNVTPNQEAVLWYIRFPRTIIGLMVGAGLAVSGAVMQGLFSNPLADPGIIGVSSGASVGAVLAIAIGLAETSMYAMPACAFIGSLMAVAITVALAMRHGKIPVMTLLLSGVVVGMLLGAITAAIVTAVDENRMRQYLFWTVGGLGYRRWEHVFIGLGPILIGSGIMVLLARHLNVLVLGETEARSLGMPVGFYRMLFLSLAALVTATGVCISGNIGFIGLVVPHFLRLIVGPDHRRLLPACLLAGGAFLVFCDTMGRVLIAPTEIRVGIMTALLGTPYFLYLLRKSRLEE